MHQLNAEISDSEDIEPYTRCSTQSASPRTKPIEITVNMDQRMEIDTGATMSIMSEATYKGLCELDFRPKLQSSTARLSTYTGERIDVLGQITALPTADP